MRNAVEFLKHRALSGGNEVSYNMSKTNARQSLIPFLSFTVKAEEAMNFYSDNLSNTKITKLNLTFRRK